MSLFFDVIHDQELIVVYVPGVESIQGLFTAVEQSGSDRRIAHYDTLILINDTSNLPPDIASLFANLVNTIEETWGDEGDYKTALVVSKALDYGISRVFTTFRGRKPEHMSVFRDLAQSMDWLDIKPENRAQVIDLLADLGADQALIQLEELD